ncbi:lysozyme inhibitor LprI family protein [Ralstonia sp. R-29]|uniref:lysozyme inhibitor LprI family protein n=1 Tax=Ralstonia sp. R-29 TaxID=3404059 RepID=UPI003CF536B0
MKRNNSPHRLRLALLALQTVAVQQAFAAGLDCSRVEGNTQTAICNSDELRRLDGQLSSVYGKLVHMQPGQRSALRQDQLDWLKTRDQCNADENCLTTQYQDRINGLQTRLHDAAAYQPDSTDRQALDDLRQAVEAMRKIDPEFPLEKALDQFRVKTGITKFSNMRVEGDSLLRFPRKRPAGVTKDEWRALQASHIDGGGENGSASYTLLHIDGKEQRDLAIHSYVGGTGLFTYTSVLRRRGERFEGAYTSPLAEESPVVVGDEASSTYAQEYLYFENLRGRNQSAEWISLRGRVYAAYRNSRYGEDNIYLLRPLSVVGSGPKLTIHYRYRMTMPQVQKTVGEKQATTLDKSLVAALTKALGNVDKEKARDSGPAQEPLCPAPDGVTDVQSYYGFGPGHYSYEIVGNIPIWVKSQCHVGQLINWFGQYSAKDGLFAQLWMRKPGDVDQQKTYLVYGRRTAIRVDASIASVAGDVGM